MQRRRRRPSPVTVNCISNYIPHNAPPPFRANMDLFLSSSLFGVQCDARIMSSIISSQIAEHKVPTLSIIACTSRDFALAEYCVRCIALENSASSVRSAQTARQLLNAINNCKSKLHAGRYSDVGFRFVLGSVFFFVCLLSRLAGTHICRLNCILVPARATLVLPNSFCVYLSTKVKANHIFNPKSLAEVENEINNFLRVRLLCYEFLKDET